MKPAFFIAKKIQKTAKVIAIQTLLNVVKTNCLCNSAGVFFLSDICKIKHIKNSIMNFDLSRPMFTLTIGEYIELQKSLMQMAQSTAIKTEEDSLIEPEEVMKILHVSKTTLWRLKDDEKPLIPVKIRGCLKYRKSDVTKYLSTI